MLVTLYFTNQSSAGASAKSAAFQKIWRPRVFALNAFDELIQNSKKDFITWKGNDEAEAAHFLDIMNKQDCVSDE